MKCPLCNKPLLSPVKALLRCSNEECPASDLDCQFEDFWTNFRKSIAAKEQKAVKRAYKQRRCKTCGLFPAGKCQYALVAHPNFGCIHWTKKGAK